MKIINYVFFLFMLLTVFSFTNVVRVNAGTTIKENSKVTIPSKSVKPLSNKKKLTKTLQNNNPIIVKQGEKVLIKFSAKVEKLTLYDKNSKKIGYFPEGLVFDITKIIKTVKGEKLKIKYHQPKPPNNSIGSPPDLMSEIIKYAKIPRGLSNDPRFKIIHPGDRNEPANNSINNAVTVSAGNSRGSVGGGDDPYDYFSYTAPSGGFGYYVEISRLSGNIKLYSYDARPEDLTNDSNRLWVSLAPGAIFYIAVKPNSSYDKTEYEINIETRSIPDELEPNDDWSQAKPWGLSGTRFLCNVMTSEGSAPDRLQGGLWDTYRVEEHGGATMDVSLTNAGLPSTTKVYAAILDSAGHAIDSYNINNSSNGISFTYGPLPASALYIRFYNSSSTSTHDNLNPYGEGRGPACFTGTGYRLNITFH